MLSLVQSVFMQCQHPQGLASLQAKALPVLGLRFVWVKLCSPSLRSTLLRVLVLNDRPDLTSFQQVKLCSLPPFRLDLEAIVVHQKRTPLAALFTFSRDGALHFHYTWLFLWLTTSFCLQPPFSSHVNIRDPNAEEKLT